MPSYVAWTAACLHALYLNVLTAPLALFFGSASSLRPLWDGQSGAASSRPRGARGPRTGAGSLTRSF